MEGATLEELIIRGLFVAAGCVLLARRHSLSGVIGLCAGILGIGLVLLFAYFNVGLVAVKWGLRICALGFVLSIIGVHLFRSHLLEWVMIGKRR